MLLYLIVYSPILFGLFVWAALARHLFVADPLDEPLDLEEENAD